MLWFDFGLALAVCLSALYMPGLILMASMRMNVFPSLALAPAVSCFLMSVACVLLPMFGVFADWVSVSLAIVGLLVLFVLAGYLFRKKTRLNDWPKDSFSLFGLSCRTSRGIVLALALCVGVGTGAAFFLTAIQAPDSFFQAFDNGHHINGIASFVDLGNWSSFSGGFYPSCWQAYAAFVSSCTGVAAPLAINVVNFCFSFVVFPVSMVFLSYVLFSDKPFAVLASCVLVTAFVAFPWRLLVFGPIYPNLAALAVTPSAIALFVGILNRIEAKGVDSHVVVGIVLFVFSAVALFFLQPNSIFTSVVFLAFFCCSYAARIVCNKFGASSGKTALLRVAAFVTCFVAIVVIWLVLHNTSFVQNLFGEPGYQLFGKAEAVKHAVALSFTSNNPQYFLVLLCVVGVVYSLFSRKYLWIVASCVLSMILFVVSASGFNEVVRNYLTGAWYHDAFRLAANAVFPCVLLASLGVYAIADLLVSAFKLGMEKQLCDVFGCALLLLVLLLAYVPLDSKYPESSAFGSIRSEISKAYSTNQAYCILTKEEISFSEKVKEIVGDDLVVNVPDDGSVFLYGAEGINVYYQTTRIWDPSSEDWESAALRLRLDEFDSDSEVRNAVEETGASYVLLLDEGATADDQSQAWFFTWRWYADWWDGITSIAEDTPGFELVLSDGDMRLYRIESA